MPSPSEIGAGAGQRCHLVFHMVDGAQRHANVWESTKAHIILEVSRGVSMVTVDLHEADSCPSERVIFNTSNITYIEV